MSVPTQIRQQQNIVNIVSLFFSDAAVLRIRDVYPGSVFSIPDPNFFHRGSRISIKEFNYFSKKKIFFSSRKCDPGCSSRIRILYFYPSRSRIQGSKRHRNLDPDPQHCDADIGPVFLHGRSSWGAVRRGLTGWMREEEVHPPPPHPRPPSRRRM